jgi:hypothetical protein
MAKFFKHVGEHNSKKVVIVQRHIPEEEHMCSVIYTQHVPSHYHDDIMRVLESPEGQSSDEFWEVLLRRTSSTGSVNILEAVAREGYLKKAPTNQVLVKPNAASSIRLDELNGLLMDVGTGEEAARKLEKLDRERGYADNRKTDAPSEIAADTTSVMSNADLAQLNIKQAGDMKVQAKALLDEAKRLEAEAKKLDPPATKSKGRKPSGTRTKKATA